MYSKSTSYYFQYKQRLSLSLSLSRWATEPTAPASFHIYDDLNDAWSQEDDEITDQYLHLRLSLKVVSISLLFLFFFVDSLQSSFRFGSCFTQSRRIVFIFTEFYWTHIELTIFFIVHEWTWQEDQVFIRH